ncbi:ABC transporter permease [Streptomyces sp. NPDC091272]|uniref:ABC transporter permease n=1 Tax=Streptomyces sp. NPDC091272 TaxID=3365981 RepID=UPI0038176E0B
MTLALRELSHLLLNYRRTWRGSVVSTIAVPVVYLLAMAYGMDPLLDGHWAPSAGSGGYLEFVGPGLLAATAMQVGVIEATYPVYGGATWHRHYYAVANTPLRPADIFHGQLLFIAVRLLISSGAFLLALTAFGAGRSPWAPAILPVAVLVGLAFAAPVAAYTVTLRKDAPIGLLTRFVVLPMFLFSGTFYPVDQLPAPLEALVEASPLHMGVELCRDLGQGVPAWGSALPRVGCLLTLVLVGALVGRRTFRQRLHH